MIEFGKEICQNFKESSSREWLETNGLGGFASSTISGINTRRYHAILIAAVKPPVQRVALVNQYEEVLISGNREWKISSHQYQSPSADLTDFIDKTTVYPEGYRFISKFKFFPWPTWQFESECWKLEKTLFMIHNQNTTITTYRLMDSSTKDLRLKVRPLLTGRDIHHLHRENKYLNSSIKILKDKIAFAPYPGIPNFYLHHNGQPYSSFYPPSQKTTGLHMDKCEKDNPPNRWICFGGIRRSYGDTTGLPVGLHWYKNFYYSIEKERGLDFLEDCWSPCEIIFDLQPQSRAFLIASTESEIKSTVENYELEEKKKRALTTELKGKKTDGALKMLLRSADQLIVQRGGNLKTIIAGYPWFTDWGRDTFISIFGLCYATGRTEIAKEIIQSFLNVVDQGMIPNHFPDSDESPQYNTVDASLWFVLAVYQYWKETNDSKFVRDVAWMKCAEILKFYREGTRYNIHLDDDGLIFAGIPGTQLTWMDAKINDRAVTPRIGKPVEIQALWYNALNMMAEMAKIFRKTESAKEYLNLAKLCHSSFNKIFWYEKEGYLYDVINGEMKDPSLRPNQIFAVSLPFELLPLEKSKSVVDVIQKHLLTPYGLRSLSPTHIQYQGCYEGDMIKRDSAYHQGTVWSWLMGPFITAYLKVNGSEKNAKIKVKEFVEPLLKHLNECGLGSISEIFDGDIPHRPRGCFSQAWSVAELLRILMD